MYCIVLCMAEYLDTRQRSWCSPQQSCDAQLKKGLLEPVVLSVLEKETSYGYKICEDVKKTIEISESTLYPILRRLELDGAVVAKNEEHNGRLRKYYSITEKGRQALADYKEQLSNIQKIIYNVLKGEKE